MTQYLHRMVINSLLAWIYSGTDSEFLERGLACLNVWSSLCWFYLVFFLNIPWKLYNLVSTRPNYFIFIGYLKNWGPRGRFKWTPSGSTTVITGECSWSSSGMCNVTCCVAPQRRLTNCNETDQTTNVETKSCTYGACSGKNSKRCV